MRIINVYRNISNSYNIWKQEIKKPVRVPIKTVKAKKELITHRKIFLWLVEGLTGKTNTHQKVFCNLYKCKIWIKCSYNMIKGQNT